MLKASVKYLFSEVLAILLAVQLCQAQPLRTAVLSDRIRTLQVQKDADWEQQPVLHLNEDGFIRISFDEMSHRYHRLTYSISHRQADWSESDLLESDFMEGFNDQPIETFENSVNTTFQYTHYTLDIPNDNVTLLVSGNYLVTIRDDEDGTELAHACFAVCEDAASISTGVSGNTEIDTNERHQQLNIRLSYPGLSVIDPEREIKVQVMQNRHPGTLTTGLRPTHLTQSGMEFAHNRKLIFPGGNEYRRFEIINMYDYSQNVDRIDFYDPYFHAILLQDSPRREYRFDMDHNGRYFIRYNRAEDSNIEADYLLVHFSLKAPHYQDGELYLDGDFTYGSLSDEYRMEYNDRNGCYEKTLTLKMGAYDYRYIFVSESSRTSKTDSDIRFETSRTEGDSYETSNEYEVYVWYREPGARYDRLIVTSF